MWVTLLLVTHFGFFPFTYLISFFNDWELQQVHQESEVHLVRARCPHHKSFIINQDLRKISLKPSFLRSLRSYAFGTLRERGSLFRDLCVSPNNIFIITN
ncbi:MAG: hypothetical protein ACKPIB_16525, partial [Dolichospermum sp.]